MKAKASHPHAKAVLGVRRAGLLLHPTSLPGGAGHGELGPEAFRFVDFLVEATVSIWQTLPLGPTHEDRSPYNCLSAHAGNPALISLERLREWGWLMDEPRERKQALHAARQAFDRQADADMQQAFVAFRKIEQEWLDDYALYEALRKENNGAPWWEWPRDERDREETMLARARARLADDIAQVCFEQFVFFRQWQELKAYANARGVLLFGDMPIFVAHDSAEVWARRRYFALDDAGKTKVVAGVPPDYFSKTGQRWGNPLYRWDRMEADGFPWWRARMRSQLELFDLIRIDHFRGFEAYWEIPAEEETAVNGRWVKAPGDALFAALRAQFDPLPIVAEDLGMITPKVHALRERHGIPGMSVLQFAFGGGADNPYLPHRHAPDTVVYTGTHDNDTTRSWYEGLTLEQQRHVLDYLGWPSEPMPWPLTRAALASVAVLAMIPFQDVLALGHGHRMNTPGTSRDNWGWRFQWEQVPGDAAARLRHLIALYDRAPKRPPHEDTNSQAG